MTSALEIRGRIHDLIEPLGSEVWWEVSAALGELERMNVRLGHRQVIRWIEDEPKPADWRKAMHERFEASMHEGTE